MLEVLPIESVLGGGGEVATDPDAVSPRYMREAAHATHEANHVIVATVQSGGQAVSDISDHQTQAAHQQEAAILGERPNHPKAHAAYEHERSALDARQQHH